MEIKMGQWSEDNLIYMTPIGAYNRVNLRTYFVKTNNFSKEYAQVFESPAGEVISDISNDSQQNKLNIEQHYINTVKSCHEIIKQDGEKEKQQEKQQSIAAQDMN